MKNIQCLGEISTENCILLFISHYRKKRKKYPSSTMLIQLKTRNALWVFKFDQMMVNSYQCGVKMLQQKFEAELSLF